MRQRIRNFSSDATNFHIQKNSPKAAGFKFLDGTEGRTGGTRQFPRRLQRFWIMSVIFWIVWWSFVSMHQRYEIPNLYMTASHTVIGMGSGYDLQTYQQFVGSLRSLGFQGNIILAVTKDSRPDVMSYLSSQNVQTKVISTVKCLRPSDKQAECIDGYNNIHISWVGYFLARSWLNECHFCSSGSVIIASIPHVKFVKNPFSEAYFNWQGLHLYQMPSLDTANWRVAKPLHYCTEVDYYTSVQYDDKDVNISTQESLHFDWDVPLLSTSIVIGDVQYIRFYLDKMISTMYEWSQLTRCPSHIHGTEMAILNYIYYNGDIYAHVYPSYRKKESMVQFMEQYHDKAEQKKYNVSSDVVSDTASIIVEYHRNPNSESSDILHSMVTEHYSMQDYAELTNDYTQENDVSS